MKKAKGKKIPWRRVAEDAANRANKGGEYAPSFYDGFMKGVNFARRTIAAHTRKARP